MTDLKLEKAYLLDKEIKEKTAELKSLKQVMYGEAKKVYEGKAVDLTEDGYVANVQLSKTFDVKPTPDVVTAMNEGVLDFLERSTTLDIPAEQVTEVVSLLAEQGVLSKLKLTDKFKVADRKAYEEYKGAFVNDLANCIKCKKVWRASVKPGGKE